MGVWESCGLFRQNPHKPTWEMENCMGYMGYGLSSESTVASFSAKLFSQGWAAGSGPLMDFRVGWQVTAKHLPNSDSRIVVLIIRTMCPTVMKITTNWDWACRQKPVMTRSRLSIILENFFSEWKADILVVATTFTWISQDKQADSVTTTLSL